MEARASLQSQEQAYNLKLDLGLMEHLHPSRCGWSWRRGSCRLAPSGPWFPNPEPRRTCVLAGVAGDGGAAAAVQRGQESALADDRESRVLVVQGRQELRRAVVALPAGDADGALQTIAV